jgi:hypothetical protein
MSHDGQGKAAREQMGSVLAAMDSEDDHDFTCPPGNEGAHEHGEEEHEEEAGGGDNRAPTPPLQVPPNPIANAGAGAPVGAAAPVPADEGFSRPNRLIPKMGALAYMRVIASLRRNKPTEPLREYFYRVEDWGHPSAYKNIHGDGRLVDATVFRNQTVPKVGRINRYPVGFEVFAELARIAILEATDEERKEVTANVDAALSDAVASAYARRGSLELVMYLLDGFTYTPDPVETRSPSTMRVEVNSSPRSRRRSRSRSSERPGSARQRQGKRSYSPGRRDPVPQYRGRRGWKGKRPTSAYSRGGRDPPYEPREDSYSRQQPEWNEPPPPAPMAPLYPAPPPYPSASGPSPLPASTQPAGWGQAYIPLPAPPAGGPQASYPSSAAAAPAAGGDTAPAGMFALPPQPRAPPGLEEYFVAGQPVHQRDVEQVRTQVTRRSREIGVTREQVEKARKELQLLARLLMEVRAYNNALALPGGEFQEQQQDKTEQNYLYMAFATYTIQNNNARSTMRATHSLENNIPLVIALDTFAARNLVCEQLCPEDSLFQTHPVCLKGIGGEIELSTMGTLCLKGGQQIQGMVVPQQVLPEGVQVLLGHNTLKELQVDLNAHLLATEVIPLVMRSAHEKGAPVPEEKRPSSPSPCPCAIGDDEKFTQSHPSMVPPLEHENDTLQWDNEPMFLAERKVRAILDQGGGFSKEEPSYLMVEYAPDLPPAIKERLQQLSFQYREVFADRSGTPPLMSYGGEHCIQLKEDAKARWCPQPRWGTAQSTFLSMWAEKMLQDGGATRAFTSRWASRIHLAPKRAADGSQTIRVCGDYVTVNEEIVKLPQPSRIPLMCAQANANAHRFIRSDAHSAYTQVPLDPQSQEICTLWTPIGLIKPTRLPFGLKNSGTVLTGRLDAIFASMDPELKALLQIYADDLDAGVFSDEQLVRMWEEILVICLKNRVTLSPAKTKVGFRTSEFLGYVRGNGMISVTEENIRPVKELLPPTSVSGVRRVLGLFQQSAHLIERYSEIAAPLQKMSGKREFHWSLECQRSFETLKEQVCQAPRAFAIDWNRQFYCETDASKLGMGAILFQLPSPLIPDQPNARNVIRYCSKRFATSMEGKPPYYREARALLWGLQKCRLYFLRSRFPVIALTDHAPLRWIKKVDNGLVSAWHLEELDHDIDYVVVYEKGQDNRSDALTREPFLNYKDHLAGQDQFIWSKLLPHLPQQLTEMRVFAGDSTRAVVTLLKAHFQARPKIKFLNPPITVQKITESKTPLLMQPSPVWSATLCHELIQRRMQFACLIPSTLVSSIAFGPHLRPNPVVAERLTHLHKITLLDEEYTWVSTFVQEDVVFSAEERKTTKKAKTPRIDGKQWHLAQKRVLSNWKRHYPQTLVKVNDLWCLPNGTVLVPPQFQEMVIKQTHLELNHASARKVAAQLQGKYTWPSSHNDIKRVIAGCRCKLAKQRKAVLSHARSSFHENPPRPCQAYGIDFYGVAKSSKGHTVILVVVDLFSRWVTLLPMKDRTAKSFVNKFLKHIIYQRGIPQLLMSDGAKEFLATATQSMCDTMGIKHLKTFHYPQPNGMVERSQAFITVCFRLLPEDERKRWNKFCPRMAWAKNSTDSAAIGMSSFQVERAFNPIMTLDTHLAPQPPDPEEYIRGPFTQHHALLEKFQKAACRQSQLQQLRARNRINSKGVASFSFKVGDKVIVFAPPSFKNNDKEPKWKHKHHIQWKAPCTVLEVLSGQENTYLVQHDHTLVTYQRHISLLHPFTPGDEGDGGADFHSDLPALNSIIAVTDVDAGKNAIWLTRLLAISEDDMCRVHYFITTSGDLDVARFKPAFMKMRTNVVTILDPPPAGYVPWVGMIPLDHIVARNIQLLDNGKVRAASRSLLSPWMIVVSDSADGLPEDRAVPTRRSTRRR